jgi:hypothetical protein
MIKFVNHFRINPKLLKNGIEAGGVRVKEGMIKCFIVLRGLDVFNSRSSHYHAPLLSYAKRPHGLGHFENCPFGFYELWTGQLLQRFSVHESGEISNFSRCSLEGSRRTPLVTAPMTLLRWHWPAATGSSHSRGWSFPRQASQDGR